MNFFNGITFEKQSGTYKAALCRLYSYVALYSYQAGFAESNCRRTPREEAFLNAETLITSLDPQHASNRLTFWVDSTRRARQDEPE